MPTLTVEGMPFVILEAMACGKPVIASRIGGTVDLISDGTNGVLTKPGDAMQLAEKICHLIDHPALRRKLSSAAKATVEKGFSVQCMLESVENVLHQAIEKTKM
jgi:glycosyltransferase involved in cell wall biosynthesis